jgi:hypothetical protein
VYDGLRKEATMRIHPTLGPLAAAAALAASLPALAVTADSWFVPFERIQLAPVERADTTRLVEAGTIQTDGFSELVFSFGGEFKEAVPKGGRVGAILIPDHQVFVHLLETEGRIIFPLEVIVPISPSTGEIFVSEQIVANVAFPAYRVYLYNETTSGATVSLFVYRRR